VQVKFKIFRETWLLGPSFDCPAAGRAIDRRTGNRRIRRRSAITAGVILGHALVFWLLAAGQGRPPASRSETGAPVGVDLVGTMPQSARQGKTVKAQARRQAAIKLDPALKATTVPTIDPVPTDITQIPSTLTVDNERAALSDADAQALSQFQPASTQLEDGPACDLTRAVVHDFSQSPVVRLSVSELPPNEKSVANAVQIWDGAWPVETLSGGKGLLRALLTREIAAAPADCRRQVNHGPVFFIVPDGEATVMVAVGSGQWSWDQLVE